MPRRRAPQPITDDDRDLFRRLYAEGLGRNAIAREMNRPAGTITNLARMEGSTFDRAATRAATEARVTELAALRTELAYLLTLDAMTLREQQWVPTLVFNIGGKDNTYTGRLLDEAPADVKRNLMTALGIAVDRSLKLAPPKDGGAEQSRSMLGDLMAGLARNYAARHGGPPPEAESPDGADGGE